MANTYKNIVITPAVGSNSADPKIVFSGANGSVNTDITLYVYPTSNGTVSIEGSAGQLFSVTNDLSNNIFRAADGSGTPLIDVYANGLVSLVPTSGNVGIANTAPAHKLSVNGTGYFSGNVTVTGRFYSGATPSAGVQVYAGGNTPSTADAYTFLTDQSIPSTATSSASAFASNPSTAAASFTLPTLNHFLATQGTIGAGSTVTNQRGFYAFNTLTGATNNYGFYSDIAAGTNRWNFYASGTAYNFLAGGLGLGTGPTAYSQLRIGGTAPSSATLSYSSYMDQTAPATTTGEFASYYSTPSTAATTFTLGSLFHFIALQGTKGAGSTITNQYGFYVGSNLTGATNNYGFYSNIPAAAGRYNLYCSGTADNYLGGVTTFANNVIFSNLTAGILKGNAGSAATVAARGTDFSLLTSGTAVASTSGTSIDFTSIPSGVKRITLIFNGVSLSGSANFLVQIGTGGSPTTSGYTAGTSALASAAITQATSTTGFPIFSNLLDRQTSGTMTLVNISGNIWVASGTFYNTVTTAFSTTCAGTVSLAGVLNMLRITTTNGTDTFDAGSVNIFYEY